MSKVVLHYFNVKSLGQGPRTLLAYGGQEFEDHRLSKEEWAVFKPKTPFGQMPVLEWDGKLFGQSAAICRYLGRKYGLVGDTLEENLEIDQNIDFFKDLITDAVATYREEDKELKIKKQEEARSKYPDILRKLEELIVNNNGHIACGKLTWGDFYVAGLYEALELILPIPDLYQQYPNLKRIYENVIAIPQVKAYIDKAPKTYF